MVTEKLKHTTIRFTEADLKSIRKIKAQLKPTLGNQTTTAIVRMALLQMAVKP